MKAWLSKLINMSDNSVHPLIILLLAYFGLAFAVVMEFMYLAWYSVDTLHNEFRPEAFGQGVGLVITGTGLLAALHMWKWPGSNGPEGDK